MELISLLDKEKPGMTYYLLGAKAQELKSVIGGKVYEDQHPTSVAVKRKGGVDAKMQGHWKEISAETGVIFFLPF